MTNSLFSLDDSAPFTKISKVPSTSDCTSHESDSDLTPLATDGPLTTAWESNSESSVIESEGNWLLRILPKLSVLILLIGSISSQFQSKAEPLSSPASRSSQIGLGSAAISSVTDALSPILPFAGGLDLRREDYQFWSTGNWWERLQDVVGQVQDAFTTVEVEIDLGAGDSSIAMQRKALDMSSNSKYIPIIAAQKPFVSLDLIGDLTLGEMSEAFRYAIESSKAGFSESRFMNSVSPRVKPVIKAMRAAVDRSKQGAKDAVLPAGKKLKNTFGQVDALKFAAAMRLFAEWRLIRQVPDGYKGYAVGMSLGHKDIVQNVAKIEQAVHQWLDYLRGLRSLNESRKRFGDATDNNDINSPTLYELLRHELDFDVHPSLPRLKEKSAAMGLLWVRRQLQYQTQIFGNVLKVPFRYTSARDAIDAAYHQVYDAYHGWAVQKIFNYSFQAAPGVEKIFRHMNPHKLTEVLVEAKTTMAAKNKSEASGPSSGVKHDNPVLAAMDHIGSEWNKLADHVGGEWDKFARFFGGILPHGQKQMHNKVDMDIQLNEEMEAFVTQEMMNDAEKQIAAYLTTVNPLLEDLAVLFRSLNMDDPTKV